MSTSNTVPKKKKKKPTTSNSKSRYQFAELA